MWAPLHPTSVSTGDTQSALSPDSSRSFTSSRRALETVIGVKAQKSGQ